MKFNHKIGTLLLAAFLIVFGAMSALRLAFEGINVVLGALAIAAGIFMLLDR